MEKEENKTPWWSISSVRICHSELDPEILTQELNVCPTFTQQPGKSKIPFKECKSAGYWCLSHQTDYPELPDQVFLWADHFVLKRQIHFQAMLNKGYDINIYIGVFSNVLALGFDLPVTPTLWKLGIPVGIEFFAA